MKKNILILEDFELVRTSLESMLTGYYQDLVNVYATSSFDKAVGVSLTYNFDIFIIDIELGQKEKNGIEFAKLLRRTKKYKNSIIIFETADSINTSKYINQIHCYGYLIKPYNPNELLVLVDSLFEVEKCEENLVKCDFKIINTDNKNFHLDNSDYTVYIAKKISTQIKLSDIIYLESFQKKVIIHTIYEDIVTSYLTLSKFIEDNKNKYFYRCKNCYIINTHYCTYYDNKKKILTLSYGDKKYFVDVARYLQSEAKERFGKIE